MVGRLPLVQDLVPHVEHLSCFEFFNIINNAAMNIRIHIFFQIRVFVLFR